jgi:hypothetical protein
VTNLHILSKSSDQMPVADIKPGLVQALKTARRLEDTAGWLQAEAADLFSELKSVTSAVRLREPVAPHIVAARAAAAWVDTAASVIEDEFCTLIGCLEAAVEASVSEID